MPTNKTTSVAVNKDSTEDIIGTNESITENLINSDSITLKRGTKGDYSWEIKVYGDTDLSEHGDDVGMYKVGANSSGLLIKIAKLDEQLRNRYELTAV